MTSNSISTTPTAIQTTPMITTQQIPIVTASQTLQQQQLAANQLHSLNPNEKRRGCRCGNATAAPGKLTCCGQRCPCYVDSKACIDCKCRGCRNPHYADGQKKVKFKLFEGKITILRHFFYCYRCAIKSSISKHSSNNNKIFSLPYNIKRFKNHRQQSH